MVMACICTLIFGLMGMNAMQTVAEERVLAREDIPVYDGGGLDRLGILVGTEKGFELEKPVTRAEAVVFIMRTLKVEPEGILLNPFEDIINHWAEELIADFYNKGFINGTSENTFSPERTVTGREFLKMLLSAMGYEGITLENALEKGKECEVISNNFTKSVVAGNYELLRSDVLRICHSTLTAQLPDKKMVCRKWIESGKYTEQSFEGILWCGLPAAKSFSGNLNSFMPMDKNYVYSPISLKMALSLAANGAEGETQKQLLEAMGISSVEEYNEQNRLLMEKYSQTDVLYLWFANSVWLNKTSMPVVDFSDEFIKNAELYYCADSFKVNEKEAPGKINKWVEEKTAGKIKKLVDKADFDAAILNAVYFKGYWVNQFNKNFNSEKIFHSRDGAEKKITFMNERGYYNYAEWGNVQIAELPYSNAEDIFDEKGNFVKYKRYDDIDISMYILLGTEKVADPESVIESAEFSVEYIDLSMPKFKIDYKADFKTILQSLGVEKAFDISRAEFTPMVNRGNMYIQNIIQSSVIEVNEKGTEAAAATAVMAGATSAMRPEPITFMADKPFTFVVRDNISGEILFMGEYAYAE